MLTLGLDLTYEEVLDLTAGLCKYIPYKTWYKIVRVKDNGIYTDMKVTYIGFDKMDVSRFFKKHDPRDIIREGRELRMQGKGVVPKRYILKNRKWVEFTRETYEHSEEKAAIAVL